MATTKLTKNETRDVSRLQTLIAADYKDDAQRAADIWMRSAPDQKAQERRKKAVKALGLSDTIKFL